METNNENSVTVTVGRKKIRPMTLFMLAICFGVSLPTFLAWLRNILDQDTAGDITFYRKLAIKNVTGEYSYYHWRCYRRFISPKEIVKICELLGDPECIMKYTKTTLASIAKEENVSVKTLRKVILQYLDEQEIHYRDYGKQIMILKSHQNTAVYNRCKIITCLTPKQAKKVREAYGCL